MKFIYGLHVHLSFVLMLLIGSTTAATAAQGPSPTLKTASWTISTGISSGKVLTATALSVCTHGQVPITVLDQCYSKLPCPPGPHGGSQVPTFSLSQYTIKNSYTNAFMCFCTKSGITTGSATLMCPTVPNTIYAGLGTPVPPPTKAPRPAVTHTTPKLYPCPPSMAVPLTWKLALIRSLSADQCLAGGCASPTSATTTKGRTQTLTFTSWKATRTWSVTEFVKSSTWKTTQTLKDKTTTGTTTSTHTFHTGNCYCNWHGIKGTSSWHIPFVTVCMAHTTPIP